MQKFPSREPSCTIEVIVYNYSCLRKQREKKRHMCIFLYMIYKLWKNIQDIKNKSCLYEQVVKQFDEVSLQNSIIFYYITQYLNCLNPKYSTV